MSSLYQLCMVLNCLLNSLGFDADVPLGGGSGTVLQQSLDKGNVEPVFVVDFRCIPLAEAVGTDAINVQIVAHDFQLLLDCPFCDGKHKVVPTDAVSQTVILHVLLNDQWNREDTPLSCLLLYYFQPEAVAIPNHITEPQLQNVTDTQAQVAFQNKGCCDSKVNLYEVPLSCIRIGGRFSEVQKYHPGTIGLVRTIKKEEAECSASSWKCCIYLT